MEYGKKQWKTLNMRNTHCRNWIVARKIKNGENETQTLYDLEYGNSEKREVWVIYTVGPGFWWENWKTWKMRQKHCMAWNIARNNEKREKWEMPTVEPGI